MQRFVIFLLDGVSSELLTDVVKKYSLKTLARYIEEGSFHSNVVSSFPTVTGPAHVPLFSGINPASINIVGHNQFIREEDLKENYLLHYKLFEKRFGDRPTLYKKFASSAAIGEPFRFGATTYRKNIFSLADWARIRGPANGYVLRRTAVEYRHGRDLIISWLHETDGFAHMSPRSVPVEKSLVSFEKFLKKFDRETDDNTVIAIVSDHGMERTDGVPFSISMALTKLNVSPKSYRYFLDGGAFGQVYLRKNGDISQNLEESSLKDIPARLASYNEIDLVGYRRGEGDDMSAIVQSGEGRAAIKKNIDGRYTYSVENGKDPLGYETRDSYDVAEILAQTGKTNYPDGIYQVYELLKAPASGDIIVTSAPGKGFNQLTRFAVHGGLNRDQSVTFMLFNKKMQGLDHDTLRTSSLYNIVLNNR